MFLSKSLIIGKFTQYQSWQHTIETSKRKFGTAYGSETDGNNKFGYHVL